MPAPVVAVLDPLPESSRAIVTRVFGSDYELRFAAPGASESGTDPDRRALVRDARALLVLGGSVDAATIEAAPGCRVLQKLGVGTDKIAVEAASWRGVTVLKAAGINKEAVAELAILLMLAVTRQLLPAVAAGRTGQVEKERLRQRAMQLFGREVGLLGMGNIGRAVARRLVPFEVSLAYFDVRRLDPDTERAWGLRFCPLDELVASVDVFSLHVPRTPETEHVVDDALLAKARPGLTLINTGRGALVDEAALLRALASGQVAAAGLDVTDQEPLPSDSPLLAHDRVVVTPHVGGAVANNFPRVIQRAFDNVGAILAGRPVAPDDVVVEAR
jgi:D-3-phosphoglycerate dehydrogenase / 2-oxoglutarate reductase